ncbi:NADPH-dependent F420 reductase [Agriterribacter humi]|uniref:NADPH-dependent F420 reductase n=1 Tax=Agriterribacter humi TaxID=1104781 RepID=UPI001264E612|nr:NAD(P)-binding domain-containing protein [Agriterribacter humi]
MNIGIIGSGEMGSALASKCIKLGHTVSIANSRGPASLKQLAGEIGAEAVSVEEVIKNKEVIIVSIPQKNVLYLPKKLFQQLPGDVVVIETGNYYPTLRDGDIPALVKSGIDSLWVQEQLGVPVVKVFNSILATSLKDMGRPKAEKNRIALAVSGNNTKAKEVVFKLVDELGFDAFDIGTIAQSWKQQPGTSIYCRDINLDELKKRADAMGTAWSDMREVIMAKRKADEALMKVDYPAYLRSLHNYILS